MLQQEGYDLIGAAMEVYNEMGHGFLEEVYQESLEVELSTRNQPFESQASIPLRYKNRPLTKTYRPDLLVHGEIIVELKALKKLTESEYAQILNYPKASGKRVGYLVNFGNPQELEWKRFIL
jgi:GxxExxY protein